MGNAVICFVCISIARSTREGGQNASVCGVVRCSSGGGLSRGFIPEHQSGER